MIFAGEGIYSLTLALRVAVPALPPLTLWPNPLLGFKPLAYFQ